MSDEVRKGLYEREIAYLDEHRKRLDEVQRWCKVVDDLETEFKDIFLSASAGFGCSCAFNLGQVRDIVPVLRRLAQVHGLRHKGVNKGGSCLSWKFRQRNAGDQGPTVLEVNAYFRSDGQCKQVQVGEKLVPIYEIRCGAGLEKVEDLVDELEKEDQ